VSQTGDKTTSAGGFGPNEWLVEELYQQYLADKDSVDKAWWDFFQDYRPDGPAEIIGHWQKRSTYFQGKRVSVTLENEMLNGESIRLDGALRLAPR